MSKKHSSKVPQFGSAPKQIGAKNTVNPSHPVKPSPDRQAPKPRGTSTKSGHRG